MNAEPLPTVQARLVRQLPRRTLVRLVGLAGVLFVVVLAVLYGFQERLIFPGSDSQGRPEAVVTPPPGTDLVTLKTEDGDRVVALFGPALTADGKAHPDAPGRPTMLLFYGNGANLKGASGFDFDRFRRLGLNVMIPDYLGYGMSGGKPSESNCYQTADACYEHLLTRKGIDKSLIVIAGRSLGGAVAIDLAARSDPAGLVTFCTFTSMAAMTRRQFPFAPTMLLKHKFDSLDKIGKVTCPILIGHGSRDSLVPASMSAALAKAAKAPVTSFVVDGAEHNDFDYEVGGARVTEELTKFLDGLKPRDHPSRPR